MITTSSTIMTSASSSNTYEDRKDSRFVEIFNLQSFIQICPA
jgi:hypothetical protein